MENISERSSVQGAMEPSSETTYATEMKIDLTDIASKR